MVFNYFFYLVFDEPQTVLKIFCPLSDELVQFLPQNIKGLSSKQGLDVPIVVCVA